MILKQGRRWAHLGALLIVGLGGLLIGYGVIILEDEAVGGSWAIAGILVLLAGLAGTWAFGPSREEKEALARTGYRDRVQREHISQIMVMPAAMLGLTVLGMSKAHDWLAGDRDFGGSVLAAVVVINILTLPVMLMGWDGQSRKMRRFLDDELTRAYRADAMTLAFWVLMIGGAAVYLLGLWRPGWGVVAMPGLLWVAATAASLRFALLHRAADRDG